MTDVLVHRQTFVQFYLADTEERVSPGSGSIVSLYSRPASGPFCNKHQTNLGKIGDGPFFILLLRASGVLADAVKVCLQPGPGWESNIHLQSLHRGVCSERWREPFPPPLTSPPLDPPPPEARRLLLPLPLSIPLTHLETRASIHPQPGTSGDAIFMTCKDINKLAPRRIDAPRRHFQIP